MTQQRRYFHQLSCPLLHPHSCGNKREEEILQIFKICRQREFKKIFGRTLCLKIGSNSRWFAANPSEENDEIKNCTLRINPLLFTLYCSLVFIFYCSFILTLFWFTAGSSPLWRFCLVQRTRMIIHMQSASHRFYISPTWIQVRLSPFQRNSMKGHSFIAHSLSSFILFIGVASSISPTESFIPINFKF